jgi:hypothetical protein
LRALYTDRRERTQLHQYLAVAGLTTSTRRSGWANARPTIAPRMPGDTAGDDLPVKPYSRMNRVTSVRRVAAQDVVPGSVADGQWPRLLRSEP